MKLRLDDAVVVITGASSGIGRATAHAFAREGAALALAARGEEALRDAARECEALGARATLVAPTDVTDPGAVERLAERTVATFGRVDVWINNAGVVLFGRFEDAEPGAVRRVMETNFFGYVHGARAAIRRFRAQGRGVLINNASVLGRVGMPYASAYVASKFAVRGLSECLRQELLDSPRIRVCTVITATMDTAIFRRGANFTPWRPKAVGPVYDPAVAAQVMVSLARRPRREVGAGRFSSWVRAGERLSPAAAERIAGWLGPALQFEHGSRRAGAPEGNLFHPIHDRYDRVGGWRAARGSRPSAFGPAALLVGGAALLLAAPALGPRRTRSRALH